MRDHAAMKDGSVPSCRRHRYSTTNPGPTEFIPEPSACYRTAPQPAGLTMRSVEAGNLASLAVGRRGRTTSSPPQFGHSPPSKRLVQASQNVHSNEQMRASVDSGGRSRLQHSQLGRSWSITVSGSWCLTRLYKNPILRAQRFTRCI